LELNLSVSIFSHDFTSSIINPQVAFAAGDYVTVQFGLAIFDLAQATHRQDNCGPIKLLLRWLKRFSDSQSARKGRVNLLTIVFRWLAAAVLLFELPIPIYWLVLHSLVNFWRHRKRAAYLTAVLAAWGSGSILISMYHRELFSKQLAPAWAIILGLTLIILEGWILHLVHRDLGTMRLVGQKELTGGGEMAATGIYRRVRHPRYSGMMAAVAGACLIAGTRFLWLAAVVWWFLALFSILLEERELRSRFGAAYEAYSRRVPRFLPLHFGPREG
jgi:protein-S-isoprenylcysteine O-methyltransferase Ste14